MGILTGKYLDPTLSDPEARLNKYRGRYGEAESRYGPRPNVMRAVRAYCDLAREIGTSPVDLAMRFVLSSPLVASTVIGATSLNQLEEMVSAARQPRLSPDVMDRINVIHKEIPNPTP